MDSTFQVPKFFMPPLPPDGRVVKKLTSHATAATCFFFSVIRCPRKTMQNNLFSINVCAMSILPSNIIYCGPFFNPSPNRVVKENYFRSLLHSIGKACRQFSDPGWGTLIGTLSRDTSEKEVVWINLTAKMDILKDWWNCFHVNTWNLSNFPAILKLQTTSDSM